MNVQIGIIRYHTITDGMKYIIKLITLFYQDGSVPESVVWTHAGWHASTTR